MDQPAAPDALDNLLRLMFVAMVIGLPLLGYWFMVLDIRAWLRALRGALVIVKNRFKTDTPNWARKYTPPCIVALGLELPCSEADIKKAYRGLAEKMHPDRGGDRQEFMMLRQHLEASLRFVREQEPAS